jgi:hypothetical protein
LRGAVWTFVVVLVLAAGALAYNFARDDETRERVKVVERRVTVDPCKKPRSVSCQRRIRLVLRELVRRRPDVLRKIGLEPRRDLTNLTESSVRPEGGGPDNPPSGGGPIGRVPPRGDDPPEPTAPSPDLPDGPPRGVALEAPVPVQVCGDLLRVNC